MIGAPARPAVSVATFRYDTTRALLDGDVTVEGADTTLVTTSAIPEMFVRMVRDHEFDVSELGLTIYLRALEQGAPFVAIPAFPARIFRHSSVWVHAGAGITGPADLVDRTIGQFGLYGQDSGVWATGILADEYGFRPERNRWVIGGLDDPAPPFDFVAQPHPADVEVTAAPPDRTLADMLETGEIDALFSSNVPRSVLDGSSRHIRRLFGDVEAVERDYHRRTGIFPIMHTVVVRRDLDPALVRAVHRGFVDAKETAVARYRAGRTLDDAATMVPWANALRERNEREFPADWWPYGVAANRTTLETYLRYHHEQGLSARRWRVEDVFAPELLDT